MNDGDRLDRALDTLLADRSPREEMADLSSGEQRMVCMVQLPRERCGQEMDKAFAKRLHGRLFQEKRHIARRSTFLSGLGALAAGVLAGVGLDRAIVTLWHLCLQLGRGSTCCGSKCSQRSVRARPDARDTIAIRARSARDDTASRHVRGPSNAVVSAKPPVPQQRQASGLARCVTMPRTFTCPERIRTEPAYVGTY